MLKTLLYINIVCKKSFYLFVNLWSTSALYASHIEKPIQECTSIITKKTLKIYKVRYIFLHLYIYIYINSTLKYYILDLVWLDKFCPLLVCYRFKLFESLCQTLKTEPCTLWKECCLHDTKRYRQKCISILVKSL